MSYTQAELQSRDEEDESPVMIRVFGPLSDANAVRIETAWNCHDDLLAACIDVESKIVDYVAGRINWRPDDFLMRVRAAIAKAQTESGT